MSDEVKGDDAVLARISQLEALVVDTQSQRSKTRIVSLIGVFITLLLIIVFALEFYGMINSYKLWLSNFNGTNVQEAFNNPSTDKPLSVVVSDELKAELESSVNSGKISQSEMDAQINEKGDPAYPEMDIAAKSIIKHGKETIPPAFESALIKVRTEIAPDFGNKILDEFKNQEAAFLTDANTAFNDVSKFAYKEIEDVFLDLMTACITEAQDELYTVFPEWKSQFGSEKTLMDQLDSAEGVFYEELHDYIDLKTHQMIPVLRGIRAQSEALDKNKTVSPEQREAIMDDFVTGMLDRIKYEFVPGLGNVIVENPEGLYSDEVKEETNSNDPKKGAK